MKYHKQTILHNPAIGQYGDCHRTAIACLLNINPSEVPHFGEHFEDNEKFNAKVDEYLAAQGLSSFTIAFNGSDGLTAVLDSVGAVNRHALYLIGGTSLRGVNHTVIGLGNRIEHDPHPSGEGICGPCDDGYFWITILTPLSQNNKLVEGL